MGRQHPGHVLRQHAHVAAGADERQPQLSGGAQQQGRTEHHEHDAAGEHLGHECGQQVPEAAQVQAVPPQRLPEAEAPPLDLLAVVAQVVRVLGVSDGRRGWNAIRPSRFACTSKVMLKSSIASPGASMSIEERIRVRYMLAKPGTMVTALVSLAPGRTSAAPGTARTAAPGRPAGRPTNPSRSVLSQTVAARPATATTSGSSNMLRLDFM